jgi:hypothetical protein
VGGIGVPDQDGDADSLAISDGISDAAPDSTGASVSAPGELALPDGEHATRAAPKATNMMSRFNIHSPPGE